MYRPRGQLGELLVKVDGVAILRVFSHSQQPRRSAEFAVYDGALTEVAPQLDRGSLRDAQDQHASFGRPLPVIPYALTVKCHVTATRHLLFQARLPAFVFLVGQCYRVGIESSHVRPPPRAVYVVSRSTSGLFCPISNLPPDRCAEKNEVRR